MRPPITLVATTGMPDDVRVFREGAALHFECSDPGNGVPSSRAQTVIDILRGLHTAGCRVDARMAADAPPFLFQGGDIPYDVPSVSWQTRFGWHGVDLIPDLCYFDHRGYEDFLPDCPDWQDRRDVLLWRGSTTGNAAGITSDNLDELPRYQLCKAAAQLGDGADVGFTGVVQAASSEAYNAVAQRLESEGAWREFVAPTDMATYRYVVDIDGNSNSWNLVQKLKLGACVLKVASTYSQWCYPDLVPWEHYVPVDQDDLTDVCAKLTWCRDHPEVAQAIARRGRQFALDMRYEDEVLRAARTVFL